MKKEKIDYNLKQKIKRITIAMLALGSLSALTIGSLTYKAKNKFHPAFWNYKSYASDLSKQTINEVFEYKEFDEITEFSRAIINNKTYAGVGTDFQIASLIKKDLIQKIDFQKLLDLDKPIENPEELKVILQTIYTPSVWQHLSSYDEELKTNENGELFEEPRHLWEYMVPYYIQDVVIGINPTKISDNKIKTYQPIFEDKDKTDQLLAQNQELLAKNEKKQVAKYSFFNIFNTLFKNGFENLTITDARRNNMLFGTSYWINSPNFSQDNINFYGQPTTEKNYKTLIDNFTSLVKDSTGYEITNSDKINLNGDGLKILTNLIWPKNGGAIPSSAALMFNGDALDAWYSSDNSEGSVEIPDGTIRIIRPENNLILLEGTIISKGLAKEHQQPIYDVLKRSFYANLNTLWKKYLKLSNNNTTEFNPEIKQKASKEVITDFYKEYLESLLTEFDDNNLKQLVINQLANIYQLTLYNDDNLFNFRTFYSTYLESVSSETLEQLLKVLNAYNQRNSEESTSYTLETNKEEYWEQLINILSYVNFAESRYNEDIFVTKYQNLENFDLINYTPSKEIEFEIVKRNYFVNEDNTIDEHAIEIYTVKDNWDYATVVHKALNSVPDRLRTFIDDYYTKKIKN